MKNVPQIIFSVILLILGGFGTYFTLGLILSKAECYFALCLLGYIFAIPSAIFLIGGSILLRDVVRNKKSP